MLGPLQIGALCFLVFLICVCGGSAKVKGLAWATLILVGFVSIVAGSFFTILYVAGPLVALIFIVVAILWFGGGGCDCGGCDCGCDCKNKGGNE